MPCQWTDGTNTPNTRYGRDEIVLLAKKIEEAGASIINTGIGWHEARIPTIATSVPRAGFSWVTKKLKGEVRHGAAAAATILTVVVVGGGGGGGEFDLGILMVCCV